MTSRPTPDDSASLTSRTVDSPVGTLTLVASTAGLRAVLWPDDDHVRVPGVATADATTTASTSDDLRVTQILEVTRQQLEEYFAGSRTTFDVALDPRGTPFQRAAWNALSRIPYGTIVSYGEQAATMGDARKARAVGAANGRNPLSIVVPCHRVVGARGALTGFAGGLEVKSWLLAHERRVSGVSLV